MRGLLRELKIRHARIGRAEIKIAKIDFRATAIARNRIGEIDNRIEQIDSIDRLLRNRAAHLQVFEQTRRHILSAFAFQCLQEGHLIFERVDDRLDRPAHIAHFVEHRLREAGEERAKIDNYT